MISVPASAPVPPPERIEVNNLYVWAISSVGALGGLLFGYDWVVIGGAKPFYERFFHLYQPSMQGWAMSCALIGCLIGAVASGMFSDLYGRKRLLTAAALVFAASSVGTALAAHFSSFVLWRILGGFAIGLASSISPMYIAEVAPAEQRGRLVSLNQLTIVIGILSAQLVNWRIARPVPLGATSNEILNSWNGQMGWRWMFGITAIPAVIFLLATFLVPESPRWLTQKGKHASARRILIRVGGEAYANQVELAISADALQEHDRIGLMDFTSPKLRRILALGLVLVVLQQWCGINIVFNYAEEVFSAAGYQVSDILFNIVVTGTVNLVFTLVALATVDRFGRRILMLGGSASLAALYTALGVFYRMHSHGIHMLLLILAAIACYAVSLAPVTWVLISEIFPNQLRGVAMSLVVTVLWIASFVLTYTFPLFNRSLGAAGTFWIYAVICVVGFIYLYINLRETRRQSLEEIQNTWN